MLFNVHFHVIQPLGYEMNFPNKPNMNMNMTSDDHNTAFEHKKESLEVRVGIVRLLNGSIHGVLPLCMNG